LKACCKMIFLYTWPHLRHVILIPFTLDLPTLTLQLLPGMMKYLHFLQ